MRRVFLFLFIVFMTTPDVHGQSARVRSADELRRMLRDSRPDSNRILLLHDLGRIYLRQNHSDHKEQTMDTAIEIFNRAALLSDSIHADHFRNESMLLAGQAWFLKDNEREGKRLFFEVADTLHAQGLFEKEARVWLKLGRTMNWFTGGDCETVDYFEKSISLYKLANNREKAADARQFLAEYLFKLNRSAEAEDELLKAIGEAKQAGHRKVSGMYFLLSVINRYRAAFDKSLLYATKCIEIAKAEGDSVFADLYYGELALVYDELDRVDESAFWYQNALNKRVERKGDAVDIFRTAGFLIRQWKKSGKSAQALELMNRLVKICPANSLMAKATIAQNFANCFDGLARYSEAERYYLEMIRDYRKTQVLDEFVAIGSMDIARFYQKRHEFGRMHAYLDSAMIYQPILAVSKKRELFHLLFTADSALGNYQAAMHALRTYQTLNDSISNERKSRQIEYLNMQFNIAEKEQSIILLEKEKKLQQNKLEKEQHTRSWILGAVVLMVVIIGLLINYLLLKQRTNKTLTSQQNEIEKKNETLQHLVEEKEWLVREIHHRVKNNFHIVQGLLGTQSGYLKSGEAINALTDSRHRIQAMSIMHQKLYQSENLSSVNTAEYVHEIISHLRSSFQTRQSIQFQLDVDAIQLDTSYCIPIGLILNETITNSIKYAFPDGQPGQISITLKHNHTHVVVNISDNGAGLPAGFNINNPDTMGMRLINGLTQDLDGEVKIVSDQGTTVTLEFAYDTKAGQ
ncbi:sensor histidine kinase [Terrimonas sp. NA20]|uniref:histidine kinase n=1 Tax=Terrimonas ginsenosidimutans TaxID=2908004 RepID=A0ABS9KMC8_9BACT|nr:sensor histidine kinase [Terrimonas ginsenosidimutans]MCG2613473.1 sensor histidine kinase [Terrimonas ginsenosidimutans]